MSSEVPFFSQTAVLEHYIHSTNPGENPDVLAIIIEVLRTKPELRRWFFFNSPHPQWAEILLEHGFLDEAPEPVATERGFLLPYWDAQNYLISIASEVPNVVLNHFERISRNKNYLDRAVSALCSISMERANQAVPKLLECLTDPVIAYAIAEPAFELMKKLAKERFADSAFALFEALPNPQPSPRAKKSEDEVLGNYVFNAEAISFLPTDHYHESRLWKPGLEELANLDLKRLVTLLENQLIQALKIEAETRGWSDEKLGYSFWRQAIEDTGQDISSSYKDSLLKWLRDFLKKLVEGQPNEAAGFIDNYLSGRYEILKRLGICLIGKFPQQYSDQVRDVLLNVENMDEIGFITSTSNYWNMAIPTLNRLISADLRR